MAGLTPMWNDNDIDNFIDYGIQSELMKAVSVFQYAGEEFVNEARKSGNYTDRTGNLRSSIGYVIGVDGKIVEEDFKEAEKGSDKSTGVSEGRKLARELLQKPEYQSGIVLIGVAGMDYAVAVESKKYDVITGSAPKAEKVKKELLKELNLHD